MAVLSFPPSVRVLLAAGATDMRKSIDGLATATRDVIRADPLSGHVRRSVFDFLHEVVIANFIGKNAPSLLPARR